MHTLSNRGELSNYLQPIYFLNYKDINIFFSLKVFFSSECSRFLFYKKMKINH